MKRLLLLGGSRYLIPVIRAAHALGHEAITCDYLPDNPAHSYSDAYHDVSILDREGVVRVAQEVRADGIMSFATDPGVVTAAYACERLGLPTCPLASVEVLQDKDRFRRFLQENGFAAPRSAGCGSMEEAVRKSGGLRWPLIVKPVDCYSSRGVRKVENYDELVSAFENAKNYSRTGTAIVEEFIDGSELSVDIYVESGKVNILCIRSLDKIPNSEKFIICRGNYPAKISEKARNRVQEVAQKMADAFGLKDTDRKSVV